MNINQITTQNLPLVTKFAKRTCLSNIQINEKKQRNAIGRLVLKQMLTEGVLIPLLI